ncbi:bifunctional 3-(3-hydroxy-phenyl)propionate/3-hydroxycinnamic acid hydroxylase [Frankia sp. ACN1ag]|uniref:bifunctional 3-(3-hydroxy-phenyl)propionate/3-hydroxycinnamic acid hydroxylase n=1 Tax=Frankia sp. ACN1ag TaxID=102891 RepID=UPI0006DCDB4D|nr:bifunctional 3-(3-hydroxy-phenyl)propionate/3-hydroxycinnamic acid hydroxylase [Frankia sp. ACN1ag]KQC38200.1 3-(3-hydroxyphenyl)propionate hydroxylase [Frankia sp. ACN1ag]
MISESADVAIVGAGPCGVTLANLLGTYGVSTVVLDRESGVIDYPRAVAVDDESLRTFQAVGLVHEVLADCIQNAPIRYHNSQGKVLAHVGPSGQPFGWPRRNLFFQPLMEATLRRGLDRFPGVRLFTDTEVTGLERTADGGVVLTGTRDGEDVTVSARYLVGADGGRSFVRRSVGVELVGETNPSKWLVVDVSDDQLDAPYSAVHCDPVRPSMTIPLPYGHRRFEFKLLPDETDERMVTDEVVLGLLARHYQDTPMPRISRRRIYWHHSRIATTFRVGPVFLAGDAAHLQPPFFGQGMNSGIRDATNLGWKLAAVLAGRADERLLDSYDAERRAHAETMVSFATRVGAMYEPRNRFTERVRDAFFVGVQRIPGARDYILQMKYKPLPRYTEGAVLAPAAPDKNSPVGRMFGQPSVETADRLRMKLDDVVGPSFAVIGIGRDPAATLSAEGLAFWRALGALTIRVDPARTARRGAPAEDSAATATAATANAEPATGTLLVRDIDGAFRDLRLGRPADEIIILRPDRYVLAVCPAAELEATTRRLRSLLGVPPAALGDATDPVSPPTASPRS